jgi:hypothetical protein
MADNAAAFAALDAHIARVKSLGEVVSGAAPEVAEVIEDELKRQISAGTDPQGKAWEPRKEDGGKPLATAAQHVTVVPVGTKVFARIKGHVARHNVGRAKGGVVRRILPTQLPDGWAKRIKQVMAERFQQHMGGRRG